MKTRMLLVGIMGAVSMTRHRRHFLRSWGLPAAGALALLALFGTEGKNTDLGAHLFGFVSGLLLGFPAEYATERCGRPGRGVNALLALCCAAVVVGAWWWGLKG